jgi:hypothetical protein
VVPPYQITSKSDNARRIWPSGWAGGCCGGGCGAGSPARRSYSKAGAAWLRVLCGETRPPPLRGPAPCNPCSSVPALSSSLQDKGIASCFSGKIDAHVASFATSAVRQISAVLMLSHSPRQAPPSSAHWRRGSSVSADPSPPSQNASVPTACAAPLRARSSDEPYNA